MSFENASAYHARQVTLHLGCHITWKYVEMNTALPPHLKRFAPPHPGAADVCGNKAYHICEMEATQWHIIGEVLNVISMKVPYAIECPAV